MQVLNPPRTRYVFLVVDSPGGVDATGDPPPPTEVIRCPRVESATAALESGRRYSAVVARHPGAELAAAARRAGVPVLPSVPPVGWDHSLDPIRQADIGPSLGPVRGPDEVDGTGRLVAVCGPGGTGASMVAAALATHRAVSGVRTLLADLALRADQSFLHGLDEVTPGVLQLVDVARYRPVGRAEVLRHIVALEHGDLLCGLARSNHWTGLGPAAFDAVLAALRGVYDLVVADVTGDLEGEGDSGSIDVEERNHMARRTTATAEAVVVVGGAGANGIRRLAVLIDDLLDHGVNPARIVPVVNRLVTAAPPPRLCGLPEPTIGLGLVASLEGGRLPPSMVAAVADRVGFLLAAPPATPTHPALLAVVPGSLGCRPR